MNLFFFLFLYLFTLKTISQQKNNFSISIAYPPINNDNKTPFLSQNRQFQWTHTGNIIYPVIPAYAASLLSKNGFSVYWHDGIAEKQTLNNWFNQVISLKPNLIAIETKTPVIKYHWNIINQLKKIQQQTSNWNLTIVLMGDHVTALPEESLNNSNVDFILTGGDYDFMLLNLANYLVNQSPLEPGFYWKKGNKIFNSGKFNLIHHDLDRIPLIDRDLTKWYLYSKNNSNYKYLPGSYIMSGRDCWWGKCTFCSWTTLYPGSQFRSFSPQSSFNEIKNLVENYHIKEVFDDSGTLPTGNWLNEFTYLMSSSGLNHKVRLGSNMRFSGPNEEDFINMKKSNLKFLLYGLESANQSTLDKINKNLKVSKIESTLKLAKKYQIDNHLTVMIGYPWESITEAKNTINFAKNLFKQGLADSIQATIIIPYPGTPLFNQAKKQHWLKTLDWNKYDMSQSILKSPIPNSFQKKMVKSIYQGIITPKFVIKKITSIKSLDDLNFLIRYTKKYLLKLFDF